MKSVVTHLLQGKPTDDDKVRKLLETGNFSKLYAHAMLETTPASAERREITRGSWVKYDQIEGHYEPDYGVGEDGEAADQIPVDDETAMRLVESLRGHGTGWCTAGTRTAAHQLSMGDFYVYYSEDDEGNYTIPRAAIRMEYGRVAEVRGIGPKQSLESVMTDIVYDKLCELPGGESYYKKVEDMRRLTEIDNRVQGGGELTAQDLVFLRFSGKIKGFGYEWVDDPRVDDLLKGRDEGDDLEIVLSDHDVDPTTLATQLIEAGRRWSVADNIDKFLAAGADIDPTAFATQLIRSGLDYEVAENPDKFISADADVDPTTFATQLINSGLADLVANNLDKFLAAGADIDATAFVTILIKAENYNHNRAVVENLDKFLAAGAGSTDLATHLINQGRADLVVYNLDKFIAAGADIDLTALATCLIRSRNVRIVARNLDKFIAAGADQTEIKRMIAEARRNKLNGKL